VADDDDVLHLAGVEDWQREGQLPELRTFSWDSHESHFFYIKNLNLEALRWPEDGTDAETWREDWTNAFTVEHRYVIRTSEMLAREIRMHTPGDEVDMRIVREGKEQTVEVELGEYSQLAIAREFDIKFPELFQVRPGETPEIFRAAPGRLLNWISEDRKYIGVQIQQLNPELAEFFGVEDGTGLLISSVEEDTPAQKAGLRVGDVIVRADGKAMKSSDRLTSLLQGLEEGDKVKLEIVRDKKTRTLEVGVAVEKSTRRRFVPEDSGYTQARSYQRFRDAFKAQNRISGEAARRHAEALKLYQENLNRRGERLKKEKIEESLKREAEVKRNYEEYLKTVFEQQKKAKDKLKIAFERYRCIKV